MLKLKKSLGQNFLFDKNIIKKIVQIENLDNKNILEIGPGSGNLTEYLFNQRPKKIILVEKDKRFTNLLRDKYENQTNLKIFNSDILKFDLEKFLLDKTIIFGNLPYNISTQILVKFISFKNWPPSFSKMIFMFQKEVADRILAKTNTKNYGRLAVLVNSRLEVTESFDVSKNCFFPKPAVNSKILVFKPIRKLNYKINNINNLEKITNIFFSKKRKMINKSFSKIFKDYERVANNFKINLSSRPAELACEDYYKLTEHYESQ